MDILEIMQALNACHGPSGNEGQVAAAIRTLAAPYVDEITTDALGNLICHKQGTGPRVMFAGRPVRPRPARHPRPVPQRHPGRGSGPGKG